MTKAVRKRPAKSTTASKSSNASSRAPRASLVEWIAAGIGLVLVLLTIGTIASQLFTGKDSPPDVTVHQLGITRTTDGYLVKFRVQNSGDSPAAQVLIQGEVTSAGAAVETSEVSFDFIPDHSSREGGLFFRHNPQGAAVALRASGYADP